MARGSALQKPIPLRADWAEVIGKSQISRGQLSKIAFEILRQEFGNDEGKLGWPINLTGDLAQLFGKRTFRKASDVMAAVQKAAFED